MKSWICSQIGLREHYAIPRVLYRQGRLQRLYTDIWWRHKLPIVSGWQRARKLQNRYHPELAEARVLGLQRAFALYKMQAALRNGVRQNGSPYDEFLRTGIWFARTVRDHLQREPIDWSNTVYYSYDTGFLETARWVREQGGRLVVGQMDPARMLNEVNLEEEARFPGWARNPWIVPEAFNERREQEWAIADLIIVNSEWSKSALLQQGVPPEKLVVIPLAYEAPAVAPIVRPLSGRLRVLWLGQVALMKGIQYFLQAARLLQNEPMEFRVVGPVNLSQKALAEVPPNVQLIGGVPAAEASAYYRSADVFVLPTLSDGFAITQIEAMAHGLPVITTPNCGRVVTHGTDGLIIPPRDPEALASALRLLAGDRNLLRHMQEQALLKVQQFSLQHLSDNLAALPL